MPHDVFISYSSHDKTVADATCAALEAQRIRCWIAPRDVLAGTEYGEAILSAIEDCRAMVLVFSAHANESPHIRWEVERAVSKGKIIVPFRIENVLPSRAMEYCLGNTHWLDALTPPLEMRIGELVASVSRLLKREDNTVVSTTPAPKPTATEIEEQEFSSLFADRPDVIAVVEAEAAGTSKAVAAEVAKHLLRIEVNVTEPGTGKSPGGREHLNRILALLRAHEAGNSDAMAFVSANQGRQVTYERWEELLQAYVRTTGGPEVSKDALVRLGPSVIPIICAEFRRMNSSHGHRGYGSGYLHTWQIELYLAAIMRRIRDFRCLPFLADAIIRRGDEMKGTDTWGAGIACEILRFGVDRKTVDACFERLVGVSASEILHEKRDRERH